MEPCKFKFSLSSAVAFQNDGHEQVQEDEADDEHVTDEEKVWEKSVSTSLYAVSLLLVVRLVICAAPEDWLLPSTVEHNVVPSFTSDDTEQCQGSSGEISEVGMFIEMIWVFDVRKEEHSENWV